MFYGCDFLIFFFISAIA